MWCNDTHFAHKIITAENTTRTGLHTRDPLAVTTPKYLPPAHLIVTDEPYAHVPQNNYIISPLTTTHTAPPLQHPNISFTNGQQAVDAMIVGRGIVPSITNDKISLEAVNPSMTGILQSIKIMS